MLKAIKLNNVLFKTKLIYFADSVKVAQLFLKEYVFTNIKAIRLMSDRSKLHKIHKLTSFKRYA